MIFAAKTHKMKKVAILFAVAQSVRLAAVTAPAEPGAVYRLDSAWREVNVPRSAFVHPFVFAKDAAGRVVYSGPAGACNQRTYDPLDSDVQRWRSYARVRSDDADVEKTSVFGVSAATLSLAVLPPETREIELKLVCEGGDAVWTNENHCISRQYGLVPRPRMFTPRLPENIPALSDAALDAALATRRYDSVKLSKSGGRTVLVLNGKPEVPSIYKMQSPGQKPDRYLVPAVFGKTGFTFFTVYFDVGLYFDEAGAERIAAELRKYLRYAPDAHFILNLDITPPDGWSKAHPDEVFANPVGKYGLFFHGRVVEFADKPRCEISGGRRKHPSVSYVSDVFAADAARVLERMFRRLGELPEGKSISGVYLNGGSDGQWFDQFDQWVERYLSADYSPSSVRCFRRHLKTKYGTPERLGAAWGRPSPVRFEEVEIPSSAAFWVKQDHFREHGASPESDYRESLAFGFAETLNTLAKAVKTGSGGRLLVGGYYSNAGLGGYPKITLTGMKKMLASPYYDFFAVVPSYSREHSDPVLTSVYNGSLVRNGKLYVGECDLRSPEVANWGYWGDDFWLAHHNAATYRRTVLKHVAEAVIRGGGYHAYDMDGGWFSTPSAQETWRVAGMVAACARPEGPLAESIALVGGERYFDHQSFGGQTGRGLSYAFRDNTQRALMFSSVPHAAFLLEDVLGDPGAVLPKVIVFNDLSATTADEFSALQSRYAKDGRVLVYMWRPGIFAADGEKIEQALGMEPSGTMAKYVEADGKCADPLMKGIKGVVAGSVYPWGVALAEGLKPLPGSGWKELARFRETGTGAVFVRRRKDFTEVYLAHPASLSAQLCRNLVREAGFWPIFESDDISGFGSGLFYALSQKSGYRTYRLPRGYRPGKVFTGQVCKIESAEVFSLTLQRGDLLVMAVER